jgi:hypothetical protein
MRRKRGRPGRAYVDDNGSVIKVLGQVLDDKKRPRLLDNQEWQLMRSCSKVAVYKAVSDVEKAYVAELGGIEGNRPSFTPEELDWCAAAAKP